MDCRQDQNKKSCACTYGCEKSGTCCACVRFHRDRGEFPACFFTKQTEASYDRSFEALVRDRQK